MELAGHLHGAFELRIVMGVEVLGIGHEFGDFPAATGVLEDEGAVEAEKLGGLQRLVLGLAVDDQLGADAGVPVDPFAVIGRKVAREVGEALFERVDVTDLGLIASKYCDDVVEDLAVEVLEEQRVESAKLVKGVELVDDAGGEFADPHVELGEMFGVEVFPELVARLGQVVLGLEDLAEARGERSVEVGRSKHVPSVGTADVYAGDALVGARLQAPLAGRALGVLRGVARLPDVAVEGVFREVVVRGADVGVAEQLADEHERRVVVALGVLTVHHDVDPVLVLEVVEGLLLVADDDDDVRDPDLPELLDLALDEDLPADLEEALGALVGDGSEAR